MDTNNICDPKPKPMLGLQSSMGLKTEVQAYLIRSTANAIGLTGSSRNWPSPSSSLVRLVRTSQLQSIGTAPSEIHQIRSLLSLILGLLALACSGRRQWPAPSAVGGQLARSGPHDYSTGPPLNDSTARSQRPRVLRVHGPNWRAIGWLPT